MVENNEPDIIDYQFYLNRSETKYMVHELTQIQRAHLLTLLGLHPKQYFEIFNISKLIRLNVYGNPSEELQNILTSHQIQ